MTFISRDREKQQVEDGTSQIIEIVWKYTND